jgi:hypothetical protein
MHNQINNVDNNGSKNNLPYSCREGINDNNIENISQLEDKSFKM